MRGSTWRRALWRFGAAILIAIVLQLASANGAHAGDVHVCSYSCLGESPAKPNVCEPDVSDVERTTRGSRRLLSSRGLAKKKTTRSFNPGDTQ